MSLLQFLMMAGRQQTGIPYDPTKIQGLIMLGQSNCWGLNTGLPERDADFAFFQDYMLNTWGIDITLPLSRVWIITKQAGTSAPKNLLDLTNNDAAGMGIEISLAHLWETLYPEGELYIMKDGRPGEQIDWWIKGSGNGGYTTIANMATSGQAHAVTAGKTLNVVGLYIHQGESYNPGLGPWSDKVLDIIGDFEADGILDPADKVVIGGVHAPTTGLLHEQQLVASTRPNTQYEDNTARFIAADDLHFPASSQWLMAYPAFNFIWSQHLAEPFLSTPPYE